MDKTFQGGNRMIIQIVKFKSALSDDEVLKVTKERKTQFQSIPGLLQEY